MIRGILTGLFFGGALGLMLAGIVSLLAPLPSNVTVPQTQEPASVQPNVTQDASLQDTSETDAPVNANSEAQAPADVEAVDGVPLADQASAPKPALSTVEDAQSVPTEGADVDVAVKSETPVLPNPQANAIANPETEIEPSISVDPAQPQSPAAVDAQAFDAPQTEAEPDIPAATQDAAPNQIAPEQQTATLEGQTPTVDSTPADAPALDAPNTEAPTPREPDTKPEVVAGALQAPVAEPAPSLLKPATSLQDRFEQRTSTRLPRVGVDTTTADAASAVATDATDQPPLKAFATDYQGPSDKPMLSVVLLDNAAADIDLATLTGFPLPISLAVDAQSPDATARAAAIRAAGLEVLAVVNFPAGATASDVAVNLDGQLANVPEAIALMDGFDVGVQETRQIADQVIAYSQSSGHGLVFQPKGLNTAQKLAVREGVGAVTVFRDFDGNGQTEVIIRRFLDQAAFKARQNEAVLMMGRLQDSTIAALASWALQDRASTVSVAPASALLIGQQK